MLVRALEVDVREVAATDGLVENPLTPEIVANDCPAGARVEPHVHGVAALGVLGRVPGEARRQPPGHRGAVLGGKPRVDVLGRNDLGRPRYHPAAHQRLPCVPPVQHRDGHAPRPLPRNTPLIAIRDKRRQSPQSAGGPKFHPAGERVDRPCLDLRHVDKPLRRGTNHNWFFGPPVVWVRVHVVVVHVETHAEGPGPVNHAVVSPGEHLEAGHVPEGAR